MGIKVDLMFGIILARTRIHTAVVAFISPSKGSG